MIREDRGAAFWIGIASHPAIVPTLYGYPPETVGDYVGLENVRHFSTESGGWLFVRLDRLGLFWDAHAMFVPEGWGREANAVLKHALRTLFVTAQVIVNYDNGKPGCRTPRSFGFRPTGGSTDTAFGPLSSWVLTRAAWEASPAFRRA